MDLALMIKFWLEEVGELTYLCVWTWKYTFALPSSAKRFHFNEGIKTTLGYIKFTVTI